jgi:hypothetical protein
MTALAVGIGGLVLEITLLLLSRNCAKLEEGTGRAAPSAATRFQTNSRSIGAMEWAEEAAA